MRYSYTSCLISLGTREMPCTESSERLGGKSVCCLWLRKYGTSDQEHYLSSIEYIFRATVSDGDNAHVIGCALDLSSFQRIKTWAIILSVLVSINWSWEEESKEFITYFFSKSVNFGDGLTRTSMKWLIGYWE